MSLRRSFLPFLALSISATAGCASDSGDDGLSEVPTDGTLAPSVGQPAAQSPQLGMQQAAPSQPAGAADVPSADPAQPVMGMVPPAGAAPNNPVPVSPSVPGNPTNPVAPVTDEPATPSADPGMMGGEPGLVGGEVPIDPGTGGAPIPVINPPPGGEMPADPPAGQNPAPPAEPIPPAVDPVAVNAPVCLNDWSAMGKGMAVSVCVRGADAKGYCTSSGESFSSAADFHSGETFPPILSITPNDFSPAQCVATVDGAVLCGHQGKYGGSPFVESGAVYVTGGLQMTCALVQGESDSVHCWTDQNGAPAPVALPPGRVLSLVASYQFACAVVGAEGAATGDVYCWGKSGNNAFLDGGAGPVKLDQLSPAKEVGPGHELICSRGAQDELTCLKKEGGAYQEVEIMGKPVVSLGPGQGSNCFAATDGTVTCAGVKGDGAAEVPGVSGAIAARGSKGGYGCALTGSGDLYCWNKGQAGRKIELPSPPQAAPCTE